MPYGEDSIDRRAAAVRSCALQAIRGYFTAQGFLEVETPVRLPRPALELHIDAVASGDAYLRTSPELHMKRLIAAGLPRIFQMGPCFRAGERGRLHNPEYTMLEWYRANADYLDVLADAKALLAHVLETVLGGTTFTYQGTRIDAMPVWDCISVADAYVLNAGWNPLLAYDGDRFDLDMVEKVEPALPRDRPVILKDYPLAAGALARRRPGEPPAAERWELYLGGIELANAYSELTDAAEQRQRFEECARERRLLGKPVYPIDEEFLAALEAGLPPCGGVALGVDRLVMLLCDAPSLDRVRPFCDEA